MSHKAHSDDTGNSRFNNPFAALDQNAFPRRGKRGSAEGASGTARPALRNTGKRHAAQPDDDTDAALFLSAMSRVEKAASGPARRGGFSLDEQGKLTEKMKDARRENGAEPRTGQTAGQPAQPSPPAAPASPPADEEEDAFLLAMKQVAPLAGKGRAVSPPVTPQSPPPAGDTSLQDFLDGKLEFALSFTDEYLEGHVVGLDPLIMGKLRSGSLSPEAHLDLHGLNVLQAFETLRGFMRGSWYKGLRTVLLVPGRGKNSPDGIGILRGKLQTWLTQDPFKRVVLAFCTAQPHDGGPGSIYVLLRKFRKKGRICWERMPADADLF